ncbi:YceD family protein [Phytohalomonas tamaricis]|uniref:YceD family protein n=1 Tax=Phytohalomonas tamaricis TaxID=2081032 RepID=UPI000D0B86E8|nr:YceD family protein [Phytohalomonas tamaricis]
MSTTRLPNTVEPYRLAASAERLEGSVKLTDMPRLVEAIGAQEGDCLARLSFDIDAQRQYFIEGDLTADVMLPCQRCLQPMPVSLKSDFLLGMVTSDALAANLPGRYEPVLVEDEKLDLLPVVEDEILLTLPQVVYHDEADCAVSRDQLQSGEDVDGSDDTAPNPFSVLRTLKDKT